MSSLPPQGSETDTSGQEMHFLDRIDEPSLRRYSIGAVRSDIHHFNVQWICYVLAGKPSSKLHGI